MKITSIGFHIFQAIIFLLLCNIFCLGQDGFYKKIIIDDKYQAGNNIIEVEGNILVLSSKINDIGQSVGHLHLINRNGEIIKDIPLNNIDPSDRSLILDKEKIIVAGNSNLLHSNQILFTLDKDLNLIDSILLSSSLFEESFQLGLNSFEDNFIVSVSGFLGNKKRLHSYFISKNPLKLDSVITLPIETEGNSSFREIFTNNNNELVYYYEHDTAHIYEKHGILTYKNGDFSEFWTSNGYIGSRVVPKGLQCTNGDYIITHSTTSKVINSILRINSESEVSWRFDWDVNGSRKRVPKRIIEARNGDIIGVGSYGELLATPRINTAPFIFRLNSEGELLWEKTYYEIGYNDEASLSTFFDLVEIEDGSIIAVGETKSVETFYDIIIVKIDQEGCIDTIWCEEENIITNSTNIDLNQNSLIIYPNPTNGLVRIKGFNKSVFYRIFYMTGTLVKEGKLNSDKTLDLSELNNGSYVIHVYDKNRVYSEQIMKF